MNKKTIRLWIVFGVIAILMIEYQETSLGRSLVSTWDLTLKGAASGGSLVLAKTRNRTVKFVSIQTSPGEPAQSVVRRLAEAINVNISRDSKELRYDRDILWTGGFKVIAEENTLKLPLSPRDYVFAGTETGLGIPKRPLSLSCSYDKENDNIQLHWINPLGGYDFLLVTCYWTDFDNRITRRISGSFTNFTIDRKEVPINIDDMDFRVCGFRDNIPSNMAAIHVSGHSQEELYGIPFTNGIAPNWMAWSTAQEIDRTAFQQDEKFPNMQSYNPARALLTKPFSQAINAPPQGVCNGVYRKFLGLTPGHTYRITACINTLEMDTAKGDWSLSLCAIPNGPDGKDLTNQQLGGLAALPGESTGPNAGRIVSYGRGKTTRGAFELLFSGGQVAGAPQSSHITLPPGANTITVWVRFNCSDPEGKVAFSGVKLEDISAIGNPKSPDEIVEEENQHEMKMLRWMDRQSREASRSEPQSK